MQTGTRDASTGSSLKFWSGHRSSGGSSAILDKAGPPGPGRGLGETLRAGRYLQEQLVLGDPLDRLDQVGRDGVGQTVPLLYLLQDGNEHHETCRGMCMCVLGRRQVG